MAIHKQSDDKILLHQPPTTLSQVESWTTFEIKEPDYIDVEFSFTIHDSDFFKNGYAGFFWASYINQPEDIGIHFKGHKNKDRKSTRLNSSHVAISYAVFCLKKKIVMPKDFTSAY